MLTGLILVAWCGGLELWPQKCFPWNVVGSNPAACSLDFKPTPSLWKPGIDLVVRDLE